jgi:uncharacterized delta-60 repeat protein
VNKRIPRAVAGTLVLGAALGLGAGAASAAGTAGTLDGTFGHGGIVSTNLGLDANGNQIQGNPFAAALQSNGDIVVAVGTSGPDAGLVRYLPDGARDTSFGNGGFAALPDTGVSSFPPRLTVQSDDKIVWAGEATAANGTGSSFGVVRFNANGTVDAGFGSGGVATTTFPVFSASVQGAQAVLIQPDGKILVGGENITGNPSGTTRAPETFGALGRFNANGSIDTSFGTGGQVQVGDSDFTALGLDANGDIFTVPSHLEFSPAGHQDATVTPAAITSASQGGTSAFLSSGAFVTASTVTIIRRTDLDVQVQRFNADGTSASASTAFDYASTSGLATRDSGAAVAVQANGQAVTAGSHAESTQTTQTSVFGLARVNPDGSLDVGFGTGGVFTTRIQGNDSALVLLIQPDGKILAIGESQNAAGVTDLTLARYLSQ